MLKRLRRQGGFAAGGILCGVVLACVVSILMIALPRLRAQTPLGRLFATGFGVIGVIAGASAWSIMVGDQPGDLAGVWLLIAILGGAFLATRFSLSALKAARGERG